MATLEEEIKRATTNGDKQVAGFTGSVRSLENLALEKGDKFTMPNDYKVYAQKLGDNEVEYIWVVLQNGNAKKFFPSTFTKSRVRYNEDGTPTTERVHTKGTAAELYRKYVTVKEGMDALKGKTLEVTDIENVRTLRFNTTQLMTSQIPTIDLVG